MTARDIRVFRNLSKKLVKTEEQGVLTRNLIGRKLGLKEKSKLRGKSDLKNGREIILLTMREKLQDINKVMGNLTRPGHWKD